ncbi:MAG: hypothetical protein HOI47_27880 [Candidatus Scalindua sp.]|jgi:hypothetical protein|nr:hypothetical protein [Candidatus Scalindua sp.]MBT7350815.1 hypothetical protein [candidate division WWE3 bacterium]
MKTSQIEHSEVYGRFSSLLRKERVAIKRDDVKTSYLGLADGIKVIGIVGWQEIGKDHIRFKTDYIKTEYRGGGKYTELWNARWKEVQEKYDPSVISAYCTKMSLPKYLKEGFSPQGKGKNGIVYVKLTKK